MTLAAARAAMYSHTLRGTLTCQADIHHWHKGEQQLQSGLLCCQGGIEALQGAAVLKHSERPGSRPAVRVKTCGMDGHGTGSGVLPSVR